MPRDAATAKNRSWDVSGQPRKWNRGLVARGLGAMTKSADPLFSPLYEAPFRRLFEAHTLALLGSGFTTVALSLLAYDLEGGEAGLLLGSALGLKMLAYVVLAPIAGGLVDRIPRRGLLVALDLIRAGLVLAFVGVSSSSEIYLLIFLINACTAGFTPIYQATIPDLLKDGAEYTKGLILSRISYDLEGLLSPALSTLALLFIGYPAFFVLNSIAFVISAILIGGTPLPDPTRRDRPDSIRYNLTFGLRAYLATPRLRGLLSLHAAVSMAGAMLIVNTVVIVRGPLQGSNADVALVFASSGAGSLLAALAMPTLLKRGSLRSIVLMGSALLPAALAAGSTAVRLASLMAAWLVLGAGMSLVQTAAGRIVEASCNPADRSAYFAAHFSLSHANWLVAYPLAGWTGAYFGLNTAFALASTIALLATLAAFHFWPRNDPESLWHIHDEVDHSHRHDRDEHHLHIHDDNNAGPTKGESHSHRHQHDALEHSHPFVIDAHHEKWPR